jgi:hypothetical protein
MRDVEGDHDDGDLRIKHDGRRFRVREQVEFGARTPVPASFRSTHEHDLGHFVSNEIRVRGDKQGDVGHGTSRDDDELVFGFAT